MHPEGPFGDHPRYYNSVENFPVMRISAITHRRDPLYLSTITGRPPDEPSVIGEVFNDLVLPVIRAQIPEVRDLWLPTAACSYRIAVVSIDKRYPTTLSSDLQSRHALDVLARMRDQGFGDG